MAHVRASLTALAAGLAIVGGSGLVTGQPKDAFPQRTAQYGEVAVFKTAGEIPKGEMAKAKAAFEAFAKFHAEYVSNPKTHTAPQEFRSEPPPPGSPLTVDQLINEIYRHLIVPSPVPVPHPIPNLGLLATASGPKEADYVRELGAALDKALGDVVRQSNERVVRVNAARMLAAACRSGAHAHYPTITALLTDQNVDPEVRYYALQAAGNLLSAYDLNDYRSRKHSHEPKVVGALVSALQNAVLKADALLPLVDVPVGKEVRKALPEDQVPVLLFIRRQAVKSLAQVRFAEYEVEKGKALYPAHTLALVALSKVPVEGFRVGAEKVELFTAKNQLADAADAAEAVVGILNMAPPRTTAAARQYAPPMADVVATGVITWATPRAADPGSKALPWKGTAARLDEGLKTWQGLFDVNYNPAQPAIKAELVPAPIPGLAKAITENVLEPINSPTRAVSVTPVQTFQRDVIRKTKGLDPRPFIAPDSPALPVQYQ